MKNPKLLLWLMFLVSPLFILNSCEESPDPAPVTDATVSGILIDEQGYAVPEAVIAALDAQSKTAATATTDEDGNFSFVLKNADENSLKIRISGAGFKTFEEGFKKFIENYGQGKKEKIRFAMRHGDSSCGAIRVTVRDSSTGSFMQNVEVKVRREQKLLKKGKTDSAGTALFKFMNEGTYNLRFAREGYKVAEPNVAVGGNCDSVNLTIWMTPLSNNNNADSCCNGKLVLYAKDSANVNPIHNATVKLWQGNSLKATKMSEQNGRVVFEKLCPGNYSVSINREGYIGKEFTLTFGCNDTLELTKLLLKKNEDSCCGSKLIFYSKDSETNAALHYTTIKLWQGNSLQHTKVTEQNGRVVFENVCAGNYIVSMNREGYDGKEFAITVGCNENLEFVKNLTKKQSEECCTAKLKLRVKDSTNMSYIQGAEVIIRDKNQQIVKQGATDAEGWVLLEGLCAPAYYYVTVLKAGYISREVKFMYNECKTIQETIWLKED